MSSGKETIGEIFMTLLLSYGQYRLKNKKQELRAIGKQTKGRARRGQAEVAGEGPDALVGNSEKQLFQRPARPRAGCDDDGGDTKHHANHPLVPADVVVVNPVWHFLHDRNRDS